MPVYKYTSDITLNDPSFHTTVGKLIDAAMGPPERNTVNFKMMQAILHILARQMRILKQKVEVRVLSEKEKEKEAKRKKTNPADSKKEQMAEGNKYKKKGGLVEGKEMGVEGEKADLDAFVWEDAEKNKELEENAMLEKDSKEERMAERGEKYEAEKANLDAFEKENADKKKKLEEKDTKGVMSGISITEKDEILIVDKGPSTRDSRSHEGSIAVVTQSQFELLVEMVQKLEDMAAPIPHPTMPDNQTLREDLAKGSATLTGTMEAMQLSARLKAAEKAMSRMASLLTRLAETGALPPNLAEHVDTFKGLADVTLDESVSSAVDGSGSIPEDNKMTLVAIEEDMSISRAQLDEAIFKLRVDILRQAYVLIGNAQDKTDGVTTAIAIIAEKLASVTDLNDGINKLFDLVNDYAEQISGFDGGMSSSMESFNEQIYQMTSDLKDGYAQIEAAALNAETTAVKELNARYDETVSVLNLTSQKHEDLAIFQNKLVNELKALMLSLEILQEQKSDRDEVQDGLRDKADISLLKGLLGAHDFENFKSQLEEKIDHCYDKFKKQDYVWTCAINDLCDVKDVKSDLIVLLNAKTDAERQLAEIKENLRLMALALGVPKTALLARQLVQDKSEQEKYNMDDSNGISAQAPMPGYSPVEAGDFCSSSFKELQPGRQHACNRWVGGSHTLLNKHVVLTRATQIEKEMPTPTKKYTAYGNDGKLYMLEEELKDSLGMCLECNQLSDENLAVVVDGAGDTGVTKKNVELVQ